jgi:hypothetical protein
MLATQSAPQTELDPYTRQRTTPTMTMILPRQRQRTRRVAPRATDGGFEFLYVRSGSGLFAGLLARLLRRLL